MKEEKGFAILETLIVVAIMTTTILIVYQGYTNDIIDEEKSLYQDDVSYLYKTNYVRKFLLSNTIIDEFLNIEIKDKLENNISDDDILALTIGTNSKSLFYTDESKLDFDQIVNFWNIKQIIVLRPDFEMILQCSEEIIESQKDSKGVCYNSFANIPLKTRDFIRNISPNTYKAKSEYVFVIVFNDGKETQYTSLYSGVLYEQ